MSHPKTPPNERVGMWSTIRAAVTAGWAETLRLIVVLIVIAALCCGVAALNQQTHEDVGITKLLPFHIPTSNP